jgi:hypothetical protein
MFGNKMSMPNSSRQNRLLHDSPHKKVLTSKDSMPNGKEIRMIEKMDLPLATRSPNPCNSKSRRAVRGP